MEARSFSPATSAEIQAQLERLIPLAWNELGISADAPATTWNVNFPSAAVDNPPIVKTRIGHTFYGRCFSQKGDQYHHDLSDTRIDQDPTSDDCVVQAGNVSATEIDMRVLGQRI